MSTHPRHLVHPHYGRPVRHASVHIPLLSLMNRPLIMLRRIQSPHTADFFLKVDRNQTQESSKLIIQIKTIPTCATQSEHLHGSALRFRNIPDCIPAVSCRSEASNFTYTLDREEPVITICVTELMPLNSLLAGNIGQIVESLDY